MSKLKKQHSIYLSRLDYELPRNHKFLVLFKSIASRNMRNSMADEKKYIRLEI